MDRKLHALVTRDVLNDTVRIDVRGSLNEETRPSLVSLAGRVRSMRVSSHILVDLSRAAFVESAALASLRTDLNATDGTPAPENAGPGVSLLLTALSDEAYPGGMGAESLAITDELATEVAVDSLSEFAEVPNVGLLPAGEVVQGRPLSEYTDEELFAASDSAFALLDSPEAFAGSDLLGRYEDIGQEISRRNLLRGLDERASEEQTA